MFAGQKLLVADDSSYYRTVISLTFKDEGLDVTTAGDSQSVLAMLEQSTPDVILADIRIPGLGGYELCRQIKQSERFGHIPVMLLASLHETIDQAEARRVGADDVVSKPFKSIRDMVNRVGSLLGGKSAETEGNTHEYSTLGLANSDAAAPPAPEDHPMADTNVKVFVEAASMTEPEPVEPVVEAAGSTCIADAELQMADTQKLEPIVHQLANETVEPIGYAQDDTIEMERAIERTEKLDAPAAALADEPKQSIGAIEMNEEPRPQTAALQSQNVFSDSLLELGDFDSPRRAIAEDLILDLDYETTSNASVVTDSEPATEPVAAVESAPPEPWPSAAVVAHSEPISEPVEAVEAVSPAEYFAPAPAYDEPVVVPEAPAWPGTTESPLAEAIASAVIEEPVVTGRQTGLSSEDIDAIARRAVELMSEKVVREIAWEVVPELAELLIKKKLEEQK